jgi:hypothetical protein
LTELVKPIDALRQQVQMLSLVLDLEQNRNDVEFCSGPEQTRGKIHYVLDENVFEMFVHPRKMKSYARTFYSQFWLKVSSEHARWADFAAQSALVTSEYLLSGALPGQESHRIYMTEWHRGELTRRLASLVRELREERHADETRESGGILETTLSALLSIKREPDQRTRREEFLKFISADRLLKDDYELLSANQKTPQDGLDRFAVARIVVRMLANDTSIEPLEQILRLVDRKKDIEGRIFNITSKFIPRGEDLQLLDSSARKWHKRLQEELELAGRPDGERAPAALWNDARSLALITWASGKCDREKERIVLVTGDQIVFNTYRRWFLQEHTSAPGQPGPFALRRLVQYTPILNLNGEFSDISSTSRLMEATRQAMEVSLLPFNLSTMRSPDRAKPQAQGLAADRSKPTYRDPETVQRGREYLTLKYVDRPSTEEDFSLRFFTDRLPEDWFSDRREELRAVCGLWKQNERVAIGSMYKLIELRLSERERLVVKALEINRNASIGDLLAERAKYLMGRILDSNVSIYLPEAGKFVYEELGKGIGERGRLALRVPIFPNITLRAGGEEHDLFELIGRALERRDSEVQRILLFGNRADTEAEPELAFAVASTLALALCSWSDADIYADLAVRAATMRPHGTSESSAQPFELRYLHAVAKRFRVGEIGKPAYERTADALRRRYKDAEEILDQCFEFHSQRHENGTQAEPPDIFPLMRALSERAALRGFYAAAIGMADMTNWPTREERKKQGAQILRRAATDLIACFGLAATVEQIAANVERREKFLARLRRQFVSNLAALRVVNRLLYLDDPLPSDFPPDNEIANMLEDFGLPDPQLPALVRAEIHAFFLMIGRDIEKNRLALDALQKDLQKEAVLALDRELLTLICSTDAFGD